MNFHLLSILTALSVGFVAAGPVEYGLCQTKCNKSAEACYRKANLTFGTVTAADADAPPAALACNAALGTCAAACAKATLADNTAA